MEILDALERKVTELLNEVTALRKRNAELEAVYAEKMPQDESERIVRLEEALKREQKLREDVLARVSTLVRRLEGLNGTD